MVVRDLGLGRADGGDEGGLAHVRETDQAHVRDQLQLQRHLNVLAGHTGLGELGDLAGRRSKVCVAVAAAAALGHGNRGVVGQVRNDKTALGVLDDGAQRHLDDEVFGVLAVAEACAALAAFVGGILALVAEVHQGGQVVIHHEDDVAAAAAVATVRAARRHEFLAVKAHRAIAALARMEPDGCDVDKVGLCCHRAPPMFSDSTSPAMRSMDGEVYSFHQKEPGHEGPALWVAVFQAEVTASRCTSCRSCPRAQNGQCRQPEQTGCHRCPCQRSHPA